MKVEPLTSSDRRKLKKEKRPSLILGMFLIVGITVINLVFQFYDILLGNEGLERPPWIQFIGIEILALGLGITTYYFLSKQLIKDLRANKKQIEETLVQAQFVKSSDGKKEYILRLANKLLISVEIDLYKTVVVGDTVRVAYSLNSKQVFSAVKLS